MPKIKIITDGTVKGTQCIKDGVDLTATENVTYLSFEVNAGMEFVSMHYGVTAPYINEKGEEQGTTTINYSFTNGGFEQSSDDTPTVGKDEDNSAIGGKIIEDLSGQAKVSRLVQQHKESD
jgi:hypothetical protein